MRFAYHQGVAGWLSGEELRIGLGCMRVEPVLLQPTVAAALAAGVTVFDTAHAYGEWLDTSLAQAQVNLVLRQLDLFGRLPEPQELRGLAKSYPGLMAPASQLRAVRQFEPPTDDEGFVAVERVPFRRDPASGVAGVFVAADAVPGFQVEDPSVPHLVFGWQVPDDVGLPGAVVASCPHPGGPPTCWCRPPLPGLVLAFCHHHGVDPARSVLAGTSSGHRALATAVGARYTSLG